MYVALFFSHYFAWHYTRAFRDLFHVWLNFFWFLSHFFSIRLLLRTLFSPFKRVTEEHSKRGIEDLLATYVVNFVSRIIGMIARVCIIGIGVVAMLVWVLLLIALLLFWIAAPFLFAVSFLYGTSLLFV